MFLTSSPCLGSKIYKTSQRRHNECDGVTNHRRNIPGSVWIWTYCSLEPEFIMTAKLDRPVLITIVIWHLQFHFEYSAQGEKPFRRLLQLLRLVVSLNSIGNCRPTVPIIKGHGTRDYLPTITNICMFKCAKVILLQWSMFTINLWYSLKVIIVVPEIGDVVRRHALA